MRRTSPRRAETQLCARGGCKRAASCRGCECHGNGTAVPAGPRPWDHRGQSPGPSKEGAGAISSSPDTGREDARGWARPGAKCWIPGDLGKREVKQPCSEDGKRVGDPSPPRGLCEVHATSPLQVSPDPGWVNSPLLLLELRPDQLCHLTPSLAEGQMDARPSCAPLGHLPMCQMSPWCPCWGSASGQNAPAPLSSRPTQPPALCSARVCGSSRRSEGFAEFV